VRGGRLAGDDERTVLRSEHGEQAIDVVVDAVLPGPGARGHTGVLGQLLAAGHAHSPAGRRGLEIGADGGCRRSDGRRAPGLSAIGRPTEDWVIGNDTLSRTMHPQADRWARRIAQRCRDDYIAAARRGVRRGTPA
jgi:diaminopimelate decarboxylase